MKKTLILILAALLALSAFKTGMEAAAPADVKTGGTLLMSLNAEPTSLNPNGNYDANNGYIIQNCFNRLIKINAKNEILPDLAKSYEVSDDGLTYTFSLHENVTFHDGEPMTSADVKFTLEQIMEQQGVASFSLGSLKDIETPDDYTVVITTDTVDAAFLYNLAYQGTYILPRHVYEGKVWGGEDAMQAPVGTGPFVFDSWEKGVRIALTRNGNYFAGNGAPYLDQVVFGFTSDPTTAKAAFLAGEYDILGTFASADFEEYRANGQIVLELGIYPSRFVVSFNMTQEPFNDVKVRQAVAHAINIDEMMTIALKEVGLKADYYLSPLFEWAIDTDSKLPAYDPDLAVSLLEEAGLTKDSSGNYLSVTVDTMNYSPFPDVAQVFKSQMAKIGIDVTINMLEYASYDEKVVKNKNFSVGITSDYQGPEVSAIASTIRSDGFMNVMGYSDEQVDAALDAAVMVVPYEERAPLYQDIQKALVRDVPYMVISEWIGYYPHWDYIQGHPASDAVQDRAGNGEFTYTWIDK